MQKYVPLAITWKCLEAANLDGGNPIRGAKYRNHKGKRISLSRVFICAFKACGGADSLCALGQTPLPENPAECVRTAKRELSAFLRNEGSAATALKRLLGKGAREDIGNVIGCLRSLLHNLDSPSPQAGNGRGTEPRRHTPTGTKSREARIAALLARMRAIWKERDGEPLP